MKGAVILCIALFLAFVSASPLTLGKNEDAKPVSVVDVPAGVPFEDSETKEAKQSAVVEPKPEEVDLKKDVEKVEDVKEDKDKVVNSEEEGNAGIFGVRFPQIVIIRRPMWQDSFAGFQSPFFSGFNRRPMFPAQRPFEMDSTEEKVNREPLGQDSQVEEQKLNETVVANNVIQRMHQQINNLFANLFNPDAFFMPRPTFPRPVFSRPSFFNPAPVDSIESEDKVDFDKLPANYSNSTSETKIIDGRLVTVNKTVHKISGNNSNGFFHFSVIKVLPNVPEEAGSQDAESVPISTDPKPLVIGEGAPEASGTKPVAEQDPKMNEVDEADQEKLSEVELKNTYEVQNGDDDLATVQPGEVQIVPIKPEKLIHAVHASNGKVSDLSSDIRVNNLMDDIQQSRLRALYDPNEVEVFDV